MSANTKRAWFLYGDSYLVVMEKELEFVKELENLFVIYPKGKIHVKPDYRFQTQCIIDISEKVGFLYLALDFYIRKLRLQKLVKYHFYNFIYNCKACLDSIAVLLNHQLNLRFKGGDRDFRYGKFCSALEGNSQYFKNFASNFGSWLNSIVVYRDSIIHRSSISVFRQASLGGRTPTEEDYISKPFVVPKKPVSLIESVYQKRKTEAREIIPFCQDSIENITNITEMAFHEIYDNITGIRMRK